MTKRCGRCGETKPVDDYAWNRKSIGKRDSYCRPCRAAYKHEHYTANRQRYIDNAARRVRAVAEERWSYLLEYFKAHPCGDCGETDPLVLEFDHREKKLFNISSGVRGKNWQAVLDEIAKCDVVCANCHRRRTARRGGFLRAAVAQRQSLVLPLRD